jgi:ATP-dependent Clp protease ATP-binding subunit ClpC
LHYFILAGTLLSTFMDQFSNFTPRAREVINIAKEEALLMKHNYIGTEHLLLALMELNQGVAVNIFRKLGIELDEVRYEVNKRVTLGDKDVFGTIPFTPRVKKVIKIAEKEAKTFNHAYVGTEHLLLALMKTNEGVAFEVLVEFDVDYELLKEEVMIELDPNAIFDDYEPAEKPAPKQLSNTSTTTKQQKTKTPNLDAYGHDLTKAAQEGKMDPVVGRANEIERAIQILCRRTKNNPVLIGEAGVGKTAIAEGLAAQIVSGNVPRNLKNKKIISLDLALMIAGTKYRGQFEERLKGVMSEIQKTKDVILFIDELHTIVGAGSAEGTMDASNIFKPALSRGELQCIGATTLIEFRKYIEKDAALERRFQQVKVDPPTVDQTVEILKGLRSKYESHHKVEYTEEALEAAASLSERYMTNKFLPDKAIDLIDEAGSRACIQATPKPPDTSEIEKKMIEAEARKLAAIKEQHFEAAAEFRDKENKLQDEIASVIFAWQNEQNDPKIVTVTAEDIAVVLAKWTGIPISKLTLEESKKLLALEDELSQKVIGQKEAVVALAKAIRRSRVNLKDPNRPNGSFMFLGPTGVGKTYLTQVLASFLFGTKDSLIQIDMSEYMDKVSVSRLIGAPPGYIGYGEGGQLTEAVHRKPYSVILFDEVEKAHPDVMHILLQILEEGKITDSLGRKIDFRNTTIILTSNVGAGVIKKQTTMGFGAPAATEDHEFNKEKVLEQAKLHFRPELLNRLNDIIVFRSLEKSDISQIVDLEVSKTAKRLEDRGIELSLNEEAKDFLVLKGYDSTYGARPMRRAVEQYVEDPMAEELLKGTFKQGSKVIANKGQGCLVFELEKKPVKQKRKKDK